MLNEYLIKDLVSDVIDNRGKSPEYHHEITEYPIIEVNSIRGDRAFPIEDKFKKFVSKEVYENWFRNGHPQKNDVLISTVGSGNIGEVALFNERGCIAQNLIALRFKKELCNQEFIYYLFSSKRYKSMLVNLDIGSAQPSIKVPHILNSTIHIPDLRYQELAANLLTRLDKKIELNKKMNKTLEEIAKTLFKSWFIDFDPVRAKAEGRPTGLSKEISDLFPESLEDSELGQIPSGWKIEKLGHHVNLTKGKSYKSAELQESDTALVTLKSFQRNGGYREDGLKEYIGSYKDEQIVSDGDLIVAFTDVTQAADVIGKPAIVIGNPNYSRLVISLDVGVIRVVPESILTNAFIYFLMLSNRYASNSLGYTNGTNVLHLKKEAITEYDFCLPNNNSLLKIYNDISINMLEKVSKNSLENITLEKLRYTLLPKLISGELKIPDAENLVEKAGI